jgi:uncharacterized cupin superfamily protein
MGDRLAPADFTRASSFRGTVPGMNTFPTVVHVDDVREIEHMSGEHWGGAYKPLTPVLDATPGRLGVSLSRLPPGRVTCPFHYHQRADEVFFVLTGRGVLRYGDQARLLRSGDCVSCPAGAKIGHQIANPFDEDMTYLAIGPNDPDEVAVYPDTGKVLVRSLGRIGFLEEAEYMKGELDRPKIFDMAAALMQAK